MSEWRPEGWENDFEYKRALEGEYLLPSVVFEDGADAMLAALRGTPHVRSESLKNTGVVGWQGFTGNGKWHLIPDKE